MKVNCEGGGLASLESIRPGYQHAPGKIVIHKAVLPIQKGLGMADGLANELDEENNSIFDDLFASEEELQEVAKSADIDLTETDRDLMTIWPEWLRS